ncbi:MAG: hypothetical protein AAGA58_12585, partial [Verrucomicrobiota bacterium]
MQASLGHPLSQLFRDLASGMHQQMFFWGRDAIHPSGNLFVQAGFEKRPSEGLQGTSCYRLPWQDGHIELHGSHAGWLSGGGGMFFVRPLSRCVRWFDASPPIPGEWPRERYSRKINEELYEAAWPFLDWLLAHEAEVLRLSGTAYRYDCLQKYKKLPRA